MLITFKKILVFIGLAIVLFIILFPTCRWLGSHGIGISAGGTVTPRTVANTGFPFRYYDINVDVPPGQYQNITVRAVDFKYPRWAAQIDNYFPFALSILLSMILTALAIKHFSYFRKSSLDANIGEKT